MATFCMRLCSIHWIGNTHSSFVKRLNGGERGLAGATNSLSGGNALWGRTPAPSLGYEKSASHDNCCRNAQMFGLVDLYHFFQCRGCLSFWPWISFTCVPQRQKAADTAALKHQDINFFIDLISKKLFFSSVLFSLLFGFVEGRHPNNR